MVSGREFYSDSDTALLNRAGASQSPDWTGLNAEMLRDITRREGIDFATAVLFDRLCKAPEHADFIREIDTRRRRLPDTIAKLEATIVIVPGALYRERPDLGGDGRLVREVVTAHGYGIDLIPVGSFSSVKANAEIICEWMRSRRDQALILISLSKGGADLKAALERGPTALFQNVLAWINVCGPLDGTPMVNWILESRIRRWFVQLKCRCQGRDFQLLTSLRHDERTGSGSSIVVPPGMKLVHLIGFPLQRHMSTGLSRFCHRILARWGPNDGTTLLADLRNWPGAIYPAWGADHYFRPDQLARNLIHALLWHLAEKGQVPAVSRSA